MKTAQGLQNNNTWQAICLNVIIAAVALFINGLGVYLTIHANIGASPWDVFNLGLSKTFGILYGTASITVSITILLIDIALKEPIGLAMFIDAVVVGKAVDFFNYLDVIPVPPTLTGSLLMIFTGLFIIGYTQYLYMRSALGCGPRDTLLVGLKRRITKLPIGVISIVLLSTVTAVGYLLGGPIGIGTIICALCAGPIMQFAFTTVHFNATGIRHQRLKDSARVLHLLPSH